MPKYLVGSGGHLYRNMIKTVQDLVYEVKAE
jgi:hypothetical protein